MIYRPWFRGNSSIPNILPHPWSVPGVIATNNGTAQGQVFYCRRLNYCQFLLHLSVLYLNGVFAIIEVGHLGRVRL
jgi:hypothetical protein